MSDGFTINQHDIVTTFITTDNFELVPKCNLHTIMKRTVTQLNLNELKSSGFILLFETTKARWARQMSFSKQIFQRSSLHWFLTMILTHVFNPLCQLAHLYKLRPHATYTIDSHIDVLAMTPIIASQRIYRHIAIWQWRWVRAIQNSVS